MPKLYDELGFSKVDLHRKKIKGFPEVIFCQGKTCRQIIGIMASLHKNGQGVLATRANKTVFDDVRMHFPDACYSEEARIIAIPGKRSRSKKEKRGRILVITGGTGDLPVAEEAAVTAEFMGNRVDRLYDVGVAGLHRLMANMKKIRQAKAIIVVAGMEGALGSVVTGMAKAPVIAVPTSIGYGAQFKGLAALLSMLNSCSPGMTVVNIDNGFGAGYFASLINK